MSKSQIQLKEMKWLTPGIELSYEKFMIKLKEKLVDHIGQHQHRYFDHDRVQWDEAQKFDESIDNLLNKIHSKSKVKRSKKIRPMSEKKLKEYREILASVIDDDKPKSNGDFEPFFSQYINQVIDSINKSPSIEKLLTVGSQLVSCKGAIGKTHQCRLLSGELSEIIRSEATRDFKSNYKFKWYASMKSQQNEISWLVFLDSNASLFNDQKALFQFYWTIYKSYVTMYKTSDVLGDQIKRELLTRCILNRIKLRVDKTEKEMIELVTRWVNFKIGNQTDSVITILPIENFVKDAFVCHDSPHSVRQYQYDIIIPTAAHFIRLVRHLFETDIFSITDISEHKDDHDYKKIELQLWLEFTFRNYEGFGADNIERYFTDSEEKMKGRKNYNEIKEKFSEKSLR